MGVGRELSEGDVSDSKQKVASLHAEATALLDAALQRHIRDREIRHDGGPVFSVSVYLGQGGASTFDDSMLTRFVVECHERGWRGTVLPSAPRHMRFQVAKRVRLAEAGDSPIMRGHPTLDEMIECRREHGSSWREYIRAKGREWNCLERSDG